MDTQISFEELSRRQKEILDKQGPVTFKQAKEQVDRLRKGSYLRSMTIQKQAEKLADQYSFLILKTFLLEAVRYDISIGEKEILEAAVDIHRKRLKDKLKELNKSL